MRVLVAGRNSKVLAKAAGTFVSDLEIHSATTKAACFDLLQRIEFDLIVACETLGDGSGLEVLSHVAVNTPNTLRIFAARPATLALLKGELGLFGLFRTLPYPINFRKLWAAIGLAREACVDEPVVTPPPKAVVAGARVRHVVLEDGWAPEVQAARPVQRQAPVAAAVSRSRPTSAAGRPGSGSAARQSAPQIATGNSRTPDPAATLRAAAIAMGGGPQPPARQQAPVPTRVTAAPARRPPAPAQRASVQRTPAARQEITSGMRAAARYAAAHADTATRIPESEAFKRARARRREGGGRLEPVVSGESLAQLARAGAAGRPTPSFRTIPAVKNRAAIFVGSGVFAATTAAVLTFFMVNANNSVQRSKLPMMASITQPIPNKVFPWQPETRQPTRQAAFMRSEASPAAVADLEAEAEAASEGLDGDPDHPGPPPPYALPPPSEPPSLESPAQPVDE